MRSSSFIPVTSAWILASAISYAILDTNENGLSDFWEKEYNEGELFPETFDPLADPDADGWTNAQEAEAGTDPFDPNPPDGMIRPTAAEIPAQWSEPDENGASYLIHPESIAVSWPTLPGKQYTLLFSPDLGAESWLPVGEPFIASGVEATYGFDISQSDRSFWRVTVKDVDTDDDGLTDAEERKIGSSTYLADTDVTDGQHVTTTTYLVSGQIPENGQPVTSQEGTTFSAWQGSNTQTLGENETVHREATVRSVDGPTITGTQFKTITTDTTPWTVKVANTVVRSGTEIITITEQTDLLDATTYPQFWTDHVKSRPWQELQAYESGPLESIDFLRPIFGDAEAAEMIRNQFRSNGFSLDGTISDPGRSFAEIGSDIRLKNLRWRWVRFNPQDPFHYEYTTPPASLSQTFHLLVSQYNHLGPYLTSGGSEVDETVAMGIVGIECNANEGSSYWQTVPLDKFDPYKLEDPTVLENMDFSKLGWSRVNFGLLPVEVKQRIPDIADDGGETTYEYETVSAVPWDQPTPGVEITGKEITGNQLTLTAEIYDALTDVTEGRADLTPKLWINSREEPPVAGDVNGVYRLQEYSYQLFPGRNEVTVSVENALGVSAHHMIVVEGDDQQGYEIVEEPPKFPEYPTYPVVYELSRASFIEEDEKITLELGGKSVEVGREEIDGETDESTFRSKPFLSVNEPDTATPEKIAAIPSDKPVFLAGLDEDLQIDLQLSESGDPVALSCPQSGLELTSPEAVEILETGNRNLTLQVKARGLGDSPNVEATLETYRGDAAEQDVSGAVQSAYQSAYEALADDAKTDPITFTVNDVTVKDGFNGLSFGFESGQSPAFQESYHTFRFDSPTERGVRVFSADQREEVVRDGVVGRPQDSYYSVDPTADLIALSKALEKSGCQVVGMIDVKNLFEDEPLKRSLMVRGPPGRVFSAFDRLYEEQGRETRSQTFNPNGAHGAALAGEIGRIQGDAALPVSAKNALNLEIAQSFQLLNSFENYVPKTFQPYIDPGDGSNQPNSWTLRGTSLPDDAASNPTAWNVTNTLSDPAKASSLSGIIRLDSTGENTGYYAQTAANAPWDLNGTRVVSLRFQIEQHDAVNGSQGAFQFAFGDGIKSWTCQIAPNQLRVDGTIYNLPAAAFPNGLEADRFYTLSTLVADVGNQASFSIEGTDIATVAGQNGGLNGIAFGDPGANIAGKVQVDSLTFDNVELAYTYGIFGADDYADSDEIDRIGNILLYLRSKGQPFRTSLVARWVKLLDPMVYQWLLEKYTGKRWDGAEQSLYIFKEKDINDEKLVDIDTDKEYTGFFRPKVTKVTTVLNVDREESFWTSIDQERNDIQLAGILMAWAYQQNDFRTWYANEVDPNAGWLDAFLIERKHVVENINKWSKRAYTIVSTGGEIAVSVLNEGADWAITINDLRQGEYMAAVGFIPFVPGSVGKAIKIFEKGGGDEAIEAFYQLSNKLNDFPGGKSRWWDTDLGDWRLLDFDNIYANPADAGAVLRARDLVQDAPLGKPVRGWSGKKLLSTFSNSSVTVFKTTEPMKVYRVYNGQGGPKSNFFTFEKPLNKSQVEADLALGNQSGPFQNYDRWVEVEIPEGEYVYMGYAAKQTDKYIGGGTQIWIEDDLVNRLGQDGWWDAWATVSKPLPQH